MSTAKPSPGVKKEPPVPSEGTGWSVVSYLIGGMLLYGGGQLYRAGGRPVAVPCSLAVVEVSLVQVMVAGRGG